MICFQVNKLYSDYISQLNSENMLSENLRNLYL